MSTELSFLVLQPQASTAHKLRVELSGGGVKTDHLTQSALTCIDLSITQSLTLYAICDSDVIQALGTGAGDERVESGINELYEKADTFENWVKLVKELFDLDPCPQSVGPLINRCLPFLDPVLYVIVSEPVATIEEPELKTLFVISREEGKETNLTLEEIYMTPESDSFGEIDGWIFCKKT